MISRLGVQPSWFGFRRGIQFPSQKMQRVDNVISGRLVESRCSRHVTERYKRVMFVDANTMAYTHQALLVGAEISGLMAFEGGGPDSVVSCDVAWQLLRQRRIWSKFSCMAWRRPRRALTAGLGGVTW